MLVHGFHHPFSRVKITVPLVSCILLLCMDLPHLTFVDQIQAKVTVHSLRQQLHSSELVRLKAILPPTNVRFMELNSEKGASSKNSWHSVLPVSEPSHCVCGSSFNTDHALTCRTGGFPSVHHNNLRDFTANLLTEVCHNVCINPPVQALTGKLLSHDSSHSEDGARLDVSAQGFWGDHQWAFFDVHVFHPNANAVTISIPSS